MTRFLDLKSQEEIDFERVGRAFLIALAFIAGVALAVGVGAGLLAFGITSDPVGTPCVSGFARECEVVK